MQKTPIFIHVPKTGGLTVKLVIGDTSKGGAHKQVMSDETQKRKEMLLRTGRTPYFFAFLRDPVDRAVSAYYYYLQNRMSNFAEHKRKGIKTVNRAEKRLSKTPAAMFHILTSGLGTTCDAFWSAALANDGKLLKKLSKFFRIFLPQAYWFEGCTEYVNFYDFSNYRPELQRLLDDLGRVSKVKIPKTHKTKHGKPKDELSPETRKKIRMWYADDYKLLDIMEAQETERARQVVSRR
jgi:hypothetical protein